MPLLSGKFTPSLARLGRVGAPPAPSGPGQVGKGPGAAGAAPGKVAVPVKDVAPPAGGFKAQQGAASAASTAAVPGGPVARPLASRQPAAAVAPSGGVNPLDHFRGAVGACFNPDFDPYRSLRDELGEVAGQVAVLKLGNMTEAAAKAVKRSLFLELAPARLARHKEAVEAEQQVQDLVQQQQRLRAELKAARAKPHAPDTLRARTEQGDAETELEELPGRVRAAEREGLGHLAAQAIDQALR